MSLMSGVNAAMTAQPSVTAEEMLELEAARRESSLRASSQRKTARKVQKSFFRAPLEFGERHALIPPFPEPGGLVLDEDKERVWQFLDPGERGFFMRHLSTVSTCQ